LDEQTVAAKRTILVGFFADTSLVFFSYYLVALIFRMFWPESIGGLSWILSSALIALAWGILSIMFIMTTCGPDGSVALIGKLLLGLGSVTVQAAVIFADRIGEIALRDQGSPHRILFLIAILSLLGGVLCLSLSFRGDDQWGKYYATSAAHSVLIVTAVLIAILGHGAVVAVAYVTFAALLLGWFAVTAIRSRNMVFR
jgi:hypothetical protein